MTQPIRIALIPGSTREGRFCDTVVRWARSRIEHDRGFALDIVDPATLGLDALNGRGDTAPVRALLERLSVADAFIVVTPEYNHSFPAPLKSLIDLAYAEWQAKPVGFVSYGGVSGGLRAVEQLRQVFAELHAVTLRDSVSFANAWEQFDNEGVLARPERAEKTMRTMLARLRWWARALREARMAAPYAEVTL